MRIKMALSVASILVTQNLLLANETTKLDDVQVVTSASGYEQNVADAPASISVITAEELQKKSYTDVIDAVKNIPGVAVAGGGNNQEITIRGMGANYTKYLIDGKPISAGRTVNGNGTDGGKIGAYLPPIDMIERIEIVRGPMSSLYGSDAMGGVINVITKKASSDTWKGSITPEYTKSVNDYSNDNYGTSMFLTGPLIKDKVSLSLDGSFQGTDESDYVGGEGQKSGSSESEKKVRKIGSELTWNVDENNDLGLRYDFTRQEYKTTLGKSVNVSSQASTNENEKDAYTVSHKAKYNDFILNTYYQDETTKKVYDLGGTDEKKEDCPEKKKENRKNISAVKENVSAWERVLKSREKERPVGKDYIDRLFTDFVELHGDRYYKDDPAVVGGIAYFHGKAVTVIAQCKGKTTKENLERNFAMPSPEGYRKALRLMKQAEKFNRPIITFVNTSGAFCGKEAEERGQGEAIARNLYEMSAIKVPILCLMIGEGGSGGALALAVADEVWMMENAVYSVLSPEGFASILWKDSKRASEAAGVMRLTAADLKELKVIEEIICEPEVYREDTMVPVLCELEEKMEHFLEQYGSLSEKQLTDRRYDRFRRM